MQQSPNLIIHVPHASLAIPTEVKSQYLLRDEQLFAEAAESADLWTDELAAAAFPAATIIEAKVSRIVLDVERYADDALEVMASVGRGMIYTHTHDGQRMRKDLSPETRLDLKKQFYDPHWDALRTAAKSGYLIDFHSYPLSAWAVEADRDAPRPEIDLGFSDGVTSEAWLASLKIHFEAFGYEVGLNTPYSGVIDVGAQDAVMLEIRRDLMSAWKDERDGGRLLDCLSKVPMP
ncbi:N-formylglutamate amidohydrolase [Ruegeria atlantica]|uniref:N-formylglutamate deformylase n=1 Tax=Ruegeria atlantica TaxID=81569 RepID=A0A0N7LPX4_9RHOB|nr:N-formylglutamate amidohydrolase [Ruegeria atlantica]CUH46428.1 N-formylglutamate deformylase [Ruegeria atlantica]